MIKAILIYYIALQATYLFLILLGALHQSNYYRGILFGEFKQIHTSPLTLPISIVIAAYNEEKMIVDTLQNILQLQYPEFEIIVVNDGSEDRTLEVLIEKFNLRPIHSVNRKYFETQEIKTVYRSLDHKDLFVVDKLNGRRADANNTGANQARFPIICQIDADCVLEPDALLRMIQPFLADSRVIAATGMIRPSNGLIVEQGKIIHRGLPQTWLPLFQHVEYLRSFQWARSGLTLLGSMLCMSGAYTLIRKDIFIKVGGANIHAVVDDFELTVSVMRYIHEHKELGPMRIAYVPDPGCYTEVPETFKALASQRNFWERAILQSLIWNRVMAFNPRYRMAGLFGYSYYFLFEALSCLVELCAYMLIPLAMIFSVITSSDVIFYFLLGASLGTIVSVTAVMLQETTRHRQTKTSELLRLLIAGFLENFGYHQFHVLARLMGMYDLLIRKRLAYGYRVRSGYRTS